ncbi:ATP-grasp domain-containing protein [Rahnella ecdela]|uniref:ATP-grasp domain-containing protein n=1 Tax=Rahnella ecdela TaxID=2816250 RepID=A0ABS6LBA3_9GAMM|nr:ATP-grasp domain-containing protein [Rahnella ecdela]MBU9844033.1 ATP-grasp domain-containing protein [Rahnella ecdela]
MKIIVLHRIPFEKIRYDQIIDHRLNEVYYFCLPGHSSDLPDDANVIIVNNDTFLASELIERYTALLVDADRLISRSEYDLIEAAKIREFFVMPGDTTAGILPLRNKWAMRYRCKQQGIPQPDFWHPLEFIQGPQREGKFLLKPRAEASSNGIQVGDYAAIKQAIFALKDYETMMVEEFIDGVIYHFDGWLSKGEPLAFVSSHYIRDCLSFSGGTPLGSVQVSTEAAHVSLVTRTLAALGYENGSFHFEAIKDASGQFWFLETAARVGGAGVAETFHLRTGLNLYHADLRYQIYGMPPVCVPLLNGVFYGWFVYPAHRLHSDYTLSFSPANWSENLLHYQCNAGICSKGAISYSPDRSPLSGVVFGGQEQISQTIESIFNVCTVVEIS